MASVNNISQARVVDLLRDSLGACGVLLEDPQVVEIMANNDGVVWVERAGQTQCVRTTYTLSVQQRLNIIRVLAGRMELVCNALTPRLSTILPETGERFQGFVPPVVAAPVFAIRRPALRVFTLEDYVGDGIMTAAQAALLRGFVENHRTVFIGGSTGTGKSTLANALLAVMAEMGERIVTIEDTPELQCPAPNTVRLYTRPGVVTMQDLVQDTLRLRPDRIIVGEVRGVEAVDLLEAMGTGHPGGLCTVHAGSAMGVLPRLEQLVRRANIPQDVARDMIGMAQPVIAYLARTPTGRLLHSMVTLEAYRSGEYVVDMVRG